MVIEVPVDVGEGIRTVNDVSMWEQMCLAAFMQRNWADNQVSCTVTFDPEKEGPQIANALDYFQYQLKGISLLPKSKLKLVLNLSSQPEPLLLLVLLPKHMNGEHN